MSSMASILKEVDGRILFGEASKRPNLYSEVINYLLANTNLLAAEFVENALGEERFFLSLAISEVLLKHPEVTYKIFQQSLMSRSSLANSLGMSYLGIYDGYVKNVYEANIVDVKYSALPHVEECLKYGVLSSEGSSILKCREEYITRLFKVREDVLKVLSAALPLAHKPSLIRIKHAPSGENVYWMNVWPYTLVYNAEKAKLMWLHRESLIREFSVEGLDARNINVYFTPLKQGIALVLKKQAKTLAVIIPRDATREPRLIEGDAVCSNSLGDLYSIELREDNVTLKKYDEYGNLILNKHLKIQLPNGFEGVDCSPTTDGGVVFNIRGAQESLIIMIDSSISAINAHKLREKVENIIPLPLGFTVFHSGRSIYVARVFDGKLKVVGPYNKPSISNSVFVGGVPGLGIIVVTNDKLFQVDVLGNILSSRAHEYTGVTTVKVISTYLFPLIIFSRNGVVSGVLAFIEGKPVKLDLSALNLEGQVLDVSYANATICFHTKDKSSVCLSPLYLKWLVDHKSIPSKRCELRELRNLYEKVRSSGGIEELYGVEPCLNSQLMEDILYLDYHVRSSLTKVAGKEIKTSLERVLEKALIKGIQERILDLILLEYSDSLSMFTSVTLAKPVVKILGFVDDVEVDLNAIVALSKALEELRYLNEGYVGSAGKVSFRILSVLEALNIGFEFLKDLLNEFPEDLKVSLHGKLVAEAFKASPIVGGIAVEVLKIMGYDLDRVREETLSIEGALSKLFLDEARPRNAFQRRYAQLLENARLDELIQYVNKVKELIDLTRDLISKSESVGVSLVKNSEFMEEFRRCLQTDLDGSHLSYCKDHLTSTFECNTKLKNLLDNAYDKIKNSECISKDHIDNAIRGLISCQHRVDALEKVMRKLNRLLLIEDNVKKLIKEMAGMRPLGLVVRKETMDRICGIISTFDENKANELLSDLRNTYRELVNANKYLTEFLSLRGKEPFTLIEVDIERVANNLVEDFRKGAVSLAEVKGRYSGISELIERLPRVAEVVEGLSTTLNDLISDPNEVNHYKATILREFIYSVIKQGFEESLTSLIKLHESLKEFRMEVLSLTSNIRKIQEIMSKYGHTRTFQLLDNVVSELTSQYKEIPVKSLSLYVTELQKLVEKAKEFDKKTKALQVELSSLALYMESLERDIAVKLYDYLSNSMSVRGDLGSHNILNSLHASLNAILNSKTRVYIENANKVLKEVKEHKKTLKSRFSKSLLDLTYEKILEDVGKLDFTQAYSKLDEAVRVVRIPKEPVKGGLTLDEILSMLEANNLDIDNYVSAKQLPEKAIEIRKLSSLSDVVMFNPTFVVRSLQIARNIDDAIRLTKLAYILAKKFDNANLVTNLLNSIKLSNLQEGTFNLLSAVGKTILNEENDIIASHLALLKIFESYRTEPATCRDISKIENLYEDFCVKEDIRGLISRAALWCSELGEQDPKCVRVLGLLGGFYVKRLSSYLDEVSKTLGIRLMDREIAPIVEVVRIFHNSKPIKVHEDLTKATDFTTNPGVIRTLAKVYGSRVKEDSAFHVLKLSRIISNIMTSDEAYRGIIQRSVEIVVPEELSEDATSMTLRVINNSELPIELKEIKISTGSETVSLETQPVTIEPGYYKDFKAPFSGSYIDERTLEKGRELLINVQTSVRIPLVETSNYLLIINKVPVPIRYHGLRSPLIRYLERLRETLEGVDIPTRLREALLGAGGNNVVLLGVSREDGRRVVVKVPGVFVDLSSMPTIPLHVLSNCMEYGNHCVNATNKCGGKVARIRQISLSPPHAVEEFVEGESLRKRLVGHKQLSMNEILRIAIEVGEALKCLHESGVYHNDVRPENVMLSHERIVLIDACIDEVWETLTRHSAIQAITPSHVGSRIDEMYTHPSLLEKLREGAITDEDRAKLDVFQLGLLIYEMLLGYNPINKLKSGIRRLLPPSMEELENVLMKACSIEKLPEITINEFLIELRKLL